MTDFLDGMNIWEQERMMRDTAHFSRCEKCGAMTPQAPRLEGILCARCRAEILGKGVRDEND